MGRGHSRRGRKGFSGPVQGLVWKAIYRETGISGREKRRFFNRVSGYMVLAAGAAGGWFGFSLGGIAGTVVGFVAGVAAMAYFVSKGRYSR